MRCLTHSIRSVAPRHLRERSCRSQSIAAQRSCWRAISGLLPKTLMYPKLERPLPGWLATVVDKIAKENGWQDDWFNDGVAFHLSSLADRAVDHLEFGTFPRDDGVPPGLVVWVPSAEYLLALKLKAVRVTDPIRGETERLDILNLMKVVGISTAEEAVALLGRCFPVSAASSEKQRFLLRNMNREGGVDAPKYPR